MPRQHLGNNDRRAGNSSRSSRSRSSSSSVRRNNNNKMDIDNNNIDFEYDEFDDNNKKKKSPNNTAAYRRKPTHSSPTIKVSDLAKKKKKSTTSGNNNNQRRRSSSSNNKPVGKPVNNTKSKTTKKNNNENVVNSNNKRKKSGGGKGKQHQGGKKKKQQVSFSVDSDDSDEDVYTSNKMKSKRGNNKKSNNTKYDDSCLFDTDDDESSSNDSSENDDDDVMIVEEEKKVSRKKNTKNKSIITKKNDNTNKDVQVLPQRVLAVDNRVMPTPTADSMARVSFLNCIPQLVEGGIQKGVLDSNSTIMASLVNGTTSSQLETSKGLRRSKGVGTLVQTSVVPRASYLFESYSNELKNDTTNKSSLSKDDQSLWLSDFVSPINSGFETTGDNQRINSSGSIKSTEGFTASDGWNCFGDLVEIIEYKLSCSSENHADSPRPITLFTTDANLFATDMTSESHIHGLERFWKRIYSSFQTSAVSSITIMIVETTSMMQVMKNVKSYENDDSSVNDYSINTSSSSFPNRLAVIQCVNDIRRRIGEMSRAQDFESAIPINLQLEIMDGNSIAFQTLLQSWVKESFAQTYASYEGGVQGRLSFDLPETLDGTMCQLSLDLQYTVLPHSINSLATKELVEDMQRISMMSPSCVEVVQTIPLSSVDSSLIYGVPMSARASLENDISRYNEMKVLARQLWVYLGRNDVALVLRACGEEDDDNVVEGRSEDQLFLLVCEQAVQRQTDAASSALNIVPDKQGSESSSSCHGMLYRYATKSQLLRFGNEDQKEEIEEEESMAGMNEQYFDYIEQSLDTLISTSVNPLLM